MGLFQKSPDPIREQEQQLRDRIAALKTEIASVQQQIQTEQAAPKLRSTARPPAPAATPPPAAEPSFEQVSHQRVTLPPAAESTAAHYNELGVRKYDPVATFRRWWSQLRGSASSNPKLVSYLAVGTVQGLRPLRYEKRVARNRFIAICLIFLALLWGLSSYVFFRRP
jgi:hypothetical protein